MALINATLMPASSVALEPTRIADKGKIIAAIEALGAGGSTAGAAGIEDAYRLIDRNFDKEAVNRVIPDERAEIEAVLKELCDQEQCCLVVTTGGTGPALRDVTPEATAAVCDKILDGFAEQMRAVSLKIVE